MHFRARDRAPLLDFGFWDETFHVWYQQGLPRHVTSLNSHEFFGMDFSLEFAGIHSGVEVGLVPPFESGVLEDRGDREVFQQPDGVRVLRHKQMSSIPQPVGRVLTDRESWRRDYLPRLDPAKPERYPADWGEAVARWTDSDREAPIFLPGGSFYGWLRDWIGMENLALLLYDDPAWFEEMVTSLADCVLGTLGRVLETGARFDSCNLWEDMCYRGGPLISPVHFKRFLWPHYRRLADLLHQHGVDVIVVDCDGKIDALIPLWLDAGINCMFPMEVGAWGADPLVYRKQYGRDLLMMGGFNKRILAGSREEIAQEVRRLSPLVEEGGFIGFCDHRVPPDVPLKNYVFYLEMIREVWAKGMALKPKGEIEANRAG